MKSSLEPNFRLHLALQMFILQRLLRKDLLAWMGISQTLNLLVDARWP